MSPVRLGSHEVITNTVLDHWGLLLPQVSVAHGREVERRNEIILHQLGQPGNLLVLLLHHLDMLSELNDALAVRLKPEPSDDSELNLCAEREDNLLVPDHAITRILLGGQDPALVWRTLECGQDCC